VTVVPASADPAFRVPVLARGTPTTSSVASEEKRPRIVPDTPLTGSPAMTSRKPGTWSGLSVAARCSTPDRVAALAA
jgi:hypothetical protein